ncbi:MAG: ElyC/SanA/YdcF family protein [Bacteroidota bacterium]
MKRAKRILKWFMLALGTILLFVVAINAWVVRSAVDRLHETVADVPITDVAVVLGTTRYVAGGRRNLYFFARIEAAVALYRIGKIKKIIVSGDNRHTSYNETDDMREELTRRGIPGAAIVNDHAGFRTLDSVVRAQRVFGQQRIVLISQRWHLQRAIFIAQAHGIEAEGYIAEDMPGRSAFSSMMGREYLARVKAFLDCYILGTEPRFPGPPEPIAFGER